MADLLPEDTLYNIFSKLPTKSLARFMCVCKQWRGYINDPHLAKIHHHVKEEPRPMHHALIKSSNNPFYQRESVLSFLRVTEYTTDGMQVEKDFSSIFQVKRSSKYQPSYEIQGYCNGLIAMVQEDHLHNIGNTFEVINPLTKECHKLPPGRKFPIIAQGLGFDHSTNTFKMVCNVYDSKQTLTRTMVHVLGTDLWREIPQVPLYHIRGEAVYANGRLYWCADTSYRIVSQLVWLDMKTEEFGVIDLPKNRKRWLNNFKLLDLNGEVGFMYHIKESDKKVVWILKHEEWMIHCVFDQSKSGYYGRLFVLGCWNKEGDILIEEWKTCAPKSRLIVYTLECDSFHSLIGPEDYRGEEQVEVRIVGCIFLTLSQKVDMLTIS